MSRLSRAHERARRRVAELAGRDLTPEQLGGRLLAILGDALPADGQQLCGLDPGTLLFNRALALDGTMIRHAPHFLRHLYLREPFAALTHPRLMRAGLPALLLHGHPATSWDLPRSLLAGITDAEYAQAFRAADGPAGGLLRLFITSDGRWIAAYEAVRYDATSPFRRSEVAFARLIGPLIGGLLGASLARERGRASGTAETPTSGVLTLAEDGAIVQRTPAANRWLALLDRDGLRLEGELPVAIWSAVAGLRAGDTAVPAVVRVPTAAGLLRVEATPGQHAGEIALILGPGRVAPAPEVPPWWPLTPNERQVVGLVLCGRDDRQIAAALAISPHTVTTHLRHTYDKLGVRGRAPLLARYIAEIHG